MPAIFFDLEGPLSPQDNAYEVLGVVENGDKTFEVISRYDDLLTLEARENYEPGDTLKLIVPFLIYHGIGEKDVKRVSSRAKIVSGARQLVNFLKRRGWKIYIVSTSYEQHAYGIAKKLGVARRNVACTKMTLDNYISQMKDEDFRLVKETEEKILQELYPGMNDEDIKKTLDNFFFHKLRGTKLGRIFNEVKVVGGARKVEAMLSFARRDGLKLSEAVALGDSITDFKMLRRARQEHGLAVAFNGNEFSVPHASAALASLDLRFLIPLLDAFENGGRKEALKIAGALEDASVSEILKSIPKAIKKGMKLSQPPVYAYLEDAGKGKIKEAVEIHKRYRKLVRGEAGKLG